MEVRYRRNTNRSNSSSSALSTAQTLITHLDAFPKIDSDYQTKSRSGGGLAIVTFLFIALMIILEVNYVLDTHVEYDYVVDFETSPKIPLNLDITIAMPCAAIDADVYDHISQTSFAGEPFPSQSVPFEMDSVQKRFYDYVKLERKSILNSLTSIEETIFRNAETSRVRAMPSELPVSTLRLSTTEQGCRFNGTLMVNRHAGTLHVLMGKHIDLGFGGNIHAHIQSLNSVYSHNFSHRIDHLSFGPTRLPFFGVLDTEIKIATDQLTYYQYQITVVPVSIDKFNSHIKTYRMSVTEKERVIDHSQGSHGQPGINFKYDFAPLKIVAKEKRKSVLQFILRLIGIIGGAFSLSNFFFFAYDFITCKNYSRI